MVTKVQAQKILEKEYFVAFPEQVNMSIHIFIHSSIKHVLSNFFSDRSHRGRRDDEFIL